MLHKLIHNPVMEHLRKARSKDWGLLILRVVTASIFIGGGFGKLFGDNSMFVGFFGKIGIPFPELAVPLVGFFEVVGGLAVILGFAVRFFAAAWMVIMTVAILVAFGLSSFKAIRLELLLLASALNLVLSGAGRYSLDHKLMEKAGREHKNAMPVHKNESGMTIQPDSLPRS